MALQLDQDSSWPSPKQCLVSLILEERTGLDTWRNFVKLSSIMQNIISVKVHRHLCCHSSCERLLSCPCHRKATRIWEIRAEAAGSLMLFAC